METLVSMTKTTRMLPAIFASANDQESIMRLAQSFDASCVAPPRSRAGRKVVLALGWARRPKPLDARPGVRCADY
jgi:hypothetical protein